jgi:hypothetical protein
MSNFIIIIYHHILYNGSIYFQPIIRDRTRSCQKQLMASLEMIPYDSYTKMQIRSVFAIERKGSTLYITKIGNDKNIASIHINTGYICYASSFMRHTVFIEVW